MSGRYSIVLADDHVMVRRGLQLIIGERADLEVIGEAGNGLELLKLLQKISPHMIILDLSMPNMRGIEAITEIRRMQPQAKILILTMHTEGAYLYRTLAAGADGYLAKEEAEEELFSAISSIQQNKVYVSPCLAQHSILDWVNARREAGNLHIAERLTLREREVLKLIAENKSNKEIADLLSISARTVERHRYNIMSKLKIKGTASLVAYALREGYL